MDLSALGWNDFFQRAFDCESKGDRFAARVASEHKHAYVLFTEEGEFTGTVLGRLLKHGPRSALPAVGDWVVGEKRAGESMVDIHAVLPRKTSFSRRAAGERDEEQVVAANLDSVFLVNGLDADFSPRRVERYLALVLASGAQPVIVFNKIDICRDMDSRRSEVESFAGSVPVCWISATTGDGLKSLKPYLNPGQTVALLGSSGVGKSTLANRLLGQDRQEIGATRTEDGKGRHTTTRRELLPIPGGGLLVDTPGMRELQLWHNAGEGLLAVFPEIQELAGKCRFRDCRHEAEPGCAVTGAVESGALEAARFKAFCKLRTELEGLGRSGKKRYGPKLVGRRIMRD